MENNTLLGATGDPVVTYDGSGVFNTNTPNSDAAPASSSLPDATETDQSETKPEESKTSGILMYAGIALIAYYFFFKKK